MNDDPSPRSDQRHPLTCALAWPKSGPLLPAMSHDEHGCVERRVLAPVRVAVVEHRAADDLRAEPCQPHRPLCLPMTPQEALVTTRRYSGSSFSSAFLAFRSSRTPYAVVSSTVRPPTATPTPVPTPDNGSRSVNTRTTPRPMAPTPKRTAEAVATRLAAALRAAERARACTGSKIASGPLVLDGEHGQRQRNYHQARSGCHQEHQADGEDHRAYHGDRDPAEQSDRKITDLKWARGSGPGPCAVIGPGQGGMGYGVLVRVTSKPRAWIWRMWLRSLRSVSVRVW